MATEAYENMIIHAVLTNDNVKWTEAHALSCIYGFSRVQLEACHANVERWLRLHGVSKMLDVETIAIARIQATVRRWFVIRALKQQYDMYSRLAKLDNPDHSQRAVALQKTLACAWGHIHGR
jgi:hypothetical protein